MSNKTKWNLIYLEGELIVFIISGGGTSHPSDWIRTEFAAPREKTEAITELIRLLAVFFALDKSERERGFDVCSLLFENWNRISAFFSRPLNVWTLQLLTAMGCRSRPV